MVIPDIGLLDDPINPTILDDTVTKKAPNIITNKPSNNLLPILLPGISVLGNNAITNNRIRLPIPTTFIERSLSVRGTTVSASRPLPFFNEPMLPLKEEIIVGMVFINVMKPPAATAPAPI